MFEKYASYRVGDFVHDEYFLRWVQSPDAESDRFWHDFQETFPYQRPVIRQAILDVQNLATAPQIAVDHELPAELWTSLQDSIDEVEKSMSWWRGFWNEAAIIIFAILGLGIRSYCMYARSDSQIYYRKGKTQSSWVQQDLNARTESRIERISNTSKAP